MICIWVLFWKHIYYKLTSSTSKFYIPPQLLIRVIYCPTKMSDHVCSKYQPLRINIACSGKHEDFIWFKFFFLDLCELFRHTFLRKRLKILFDYSFSCRLFHSWLPKHALLPPFYPQFISVKNKSRVMKSLVFFNKSEENSIKFGLTNIIVRRNEDQKKVR